MKKHLVVIALLLLAAMALTGCGQSVEKLNNKGNEAFANQDYDSALLAYNDAQEDAPEMAEPYYNAANTHYRQEDYEQAQQQIERALVGEEHLENLDQNSYYNLGNTFFQGQQLEAAIEAYKEALRLNPDDLQAKQNLELALRQQQQEQQQQEQQENQDQQEEQQDEEQQDQQDEQQNEEQQDEQQQDEQQNEDQQDQQQDEQQQDGEPNDEQQEQESQANGQPDPLEGLTEEQAEQLLEAAAEGTESLEEFLQQIMAFPPSDPMEDW